MPLPTDQPRAALSIKLLPFTHHNPASWLYRVEGQFRVAGLTDKVLKEDIAINALLEEIYRKVTPWVTTTTSPATFQKLKATLVEACSLPVSERAAPALDLTINPRQDANLLEMWHALHDLLLLPKTDSRHKEISLSREILLRQLLPEVHGQITEPYTLSVEELIRTVLQLTDSTRAAKRASMPAHPINCLQPENPATECTNVVTRRRPPHHQKKERPGLCYYHQRFGKEAQNCKAPLPFRPSKKRGRQRPPSQAAMAAASKTPRSPAPVGFYVRDTVSGRMMLIDTGARRSVFPPSREDCRRPPDLAAYLRATNRFPILSYSTRLLAPAKHGIYHHINTRGPPTHAKFQRLPQQRLQEAKNAFAEMERMGICRKAPRPWASPLHMVPQGTPSTHPEGPAAPAGEWPHR
ncbi:uncharacterized protein [Macrobrachium rosenbergii]|uniref:uncharacterized protein n=1 Tax=Macrobrachium rosenbergii TaxID=79674 RepID=UPI0034D49914